MRTIIVESYNPEWQESFKEIKAYIAQYIGDLIIDIVHVGSTSVPGLAAKPIIDFDVIIESYDVFPAVAARLNEIGYIHEGDLGVPGRECFKRDVKENFMPYHMYVCPKDSQALQRHIQFRDYLRSHDEARDEYAELKKSLAEKYRHDIDSYIEGKHKFVETVLEKAREVIK